MEHLRRLKWLNLAIGAFTGLIALFVFAMFVLPGLWIWWEGESEGLVFALIGLASCLVLGGIAAAHVVVGYLVGSGRGRVAQTYLAATQLMSFPVGTFYATYALWVLWVHEPSRARFDSPVKPPVT